MPPGGSINHVLSTAAALGILLGSAALVACAGRTVLEDRDSSEPVRDSSIIMPRDAGMDGPRPADAGLDGARPADVGADGNLPAMIEANCRQFCALVETSFPQCTHLITIPSRPVSCSTWCAEAPDAEFSACATEALTYTQCIIQPGNFQGCDGGGAFIFPACNAANHAVIACLRP